MNEHDRALTPAWITAREDENINFRDILRVKRSVVAYLKTSGKGSQTRIKRVLVGYVRAQDRCR